ncbi:MAG: peptidoglycan DD-metalloendopeptidase family protein [Azospirillaceae bacterium]|nr:peptidoglycan DD-metalloendopeptidase family protein [Azospirillaceae bacterium]
MMALLSACAAPGSNPGPGNEPPLAVAPPSAIVVGSDETLDVIARRYEVSRRDLIETNHLTPPYKLSPGQQLMLPAVRLHTVRRGETLFGIAHTYRIDSSVLVQLNNLAPPYKILVGQVLRIPGGPGGADRAPPAATVARPVPGGATALPPVTVAGDSSRPSGASSPGSVTTTELAPPPGAAAAPPPAAPPPAAPEPAERPAADAHEPRTLGPATLLPPPGAKPEPSGGEAARAEPAKTGSPARPAASEAASEPARESDGNKGAAVAAAPEAVPSPPPRAGRRFLWPIHGNVLSDFGSKPDGLHNDGVNIAAPRGTPVRAAENGVVAYAGNELRGFGNLLLLRHADGWMTAYAHLEELQVRRGAKVTRGQVIGTVGASGNVNEPQLHFEIRRNSQPVDPHDLMEGHTAG